MFVDVWDHFSRTSKSKGWLSPKQRKKNKTWLVRIVRKVQYKSKVRKPTQTGNGKIP